MRIPRLVRPVVLAAALGGATMAVVSAPPLPQDPLYHQLADTRSCAGLPNCLNVLSNVPFAIVGLLGLAAVRRAARTEAFRDPWERWPYVGLFVGTALTAAGSAYYHLAPDNERLFWDRLPMTVGFMGLLTAVIAERLGCRAARWSLGPLLVLGAASVWYWRLTEAAGAGDLRPYLLVQFGSLLAVLLMLSLYRSSYTETGWFYAGLGAYALAKLAEVADAAILAFGGLVSGHTLKHLLAAAGVACLAVMLRVRRQTQAPAGVPFAGG